MIKKRKHLGGGAFAFISRPCGCARLANEKNHDTPGRVVSGVKGNMVKRKRGLLSYIANMR